MKSCIALTFILFSFQLIAQEQGFNWEVRFTPQQSDQYYRITGNDDSGDLENNLKELFHPKLSYSIFLAGGKQISKKIKLSIGIGFQDIGSKTKYLKDDIITIDTLNSNFRVGSKEETKHKYFTIPIQLNYSILKFK